MTTLSTFDEQKYARLLSRALPVKIRTEAEYDRMNAIIRELVDRDDDGLSPEEERLLDLLSDLIQQYDEEYYPVKEPTPHEMLRSLMDDNGLRLQDIWHLFDSQGVASEVLNEKRTISKIQARRLGDFFKIAPEVFLEKGGMKDPSRS